LLEIAIGLVAAVALIFLQCREARRYLQSKRPKAETTPRIPQNYYGVFYFSALSRLANYAAAVMSPSEATIVVEVAAQLRCDECHSTVNPRSFHKPPTTLQLPMYANLATSYSLGIYFFDMSRISE
jgi:hypothetical protein